MLPLAPGAWRSPRLDNFPGRRGRISPGYPGGPFPLAGFPGLFKLGYQFIELFHRYGRGGGE